MKAPTATVKISHAFFLKLFELNPLKVSFIFLDETLLKSLKVSTNMKFF
jgi:hypothetical protein